MNRNVTQIASDVMASLENHSWPGNVRELKNVIERALILSRNSSEIRTEHLAFHISEKNSETLGINFEFDKEPSLLDIEKYYLKIRIFGLTRL